jgi:hypothetical protein
LAVLTVALHADDIIASWDESVGSNGFLADLADEAVSVPLSALVFVFLHADFEHVTTANTPWCEHLFVARRTIKPVVLERERLVNKRDMACGTVETLVMPMDVFV